MENLQDNFDEVTMYGRYNGSPQHRTATILMAVYSAKMAVENSIRRLEYDLKNSNPLTYDVCGGRWRKLLKRRKKGLKWCNNEVKRLSYKLATHG